MKLFDSAFSPFARKVRMALECKELQHDVLDGLRKENRDALAAVNGRIEVPALVDGDVVVVNSADIVGYLEHRYSDRPVYPADPRARARARAWERTADTLIDAILANISYWNWSVRSDTMPEGLLEAAQHDLDLIYDAVNEDLQGKEYLVGELSIADIALFPHLVAVKSLRVPFSRDKHASIARWLDRMRALDICQADVERARTFMRNIDQSKIETRRLFWRGDRIEWLLARGFHKWFMQEIEEDRVLWPGMGLPIALSGKTAGLTSQ